MIRQQMLNNMTSNELSEWMAYFEIEPFGEERADIRSAIVANTVASVNGNKCKIADFMPKFEEAKPIEHSMEFVKKALTTMIPQKKGKK